MKLVKNYLQDIIGDMKDFDITIQVEHIDMECPSKISTKVSISSEIDLTDCKSQEISLGEPKMKQEKETIIENIEHVRKYDKTGLF